MSSREILAGLDAGHIDTKAVVMRGREAVGHSTAPTGLDPAAAAPAALDHALAEAGVSATDLAGVFTTGIFRDVVETPHLRVTGTFAEHMADAAGALFLNKDARTVIDAGGNIHKIVRFDENGDLIDVVQNDKCADGLGIFYTTAARALGLNEPELSELAARSTRDLSIAIQCALSAGSEAVDLVCQGAATADVAHAIEGYVVERLAALCAAMPLAKEIMVAGGLARSPTLIARLRAATGHDLTVPHLPQYVGAIGAVMRGRR